MDNESGKNIDNTKKSVFTLNVQSNFIKFLRSSSSSFIFLYLEDEFGNVVDYNRLNLLVELKSGRTIYKSLQPNEHFFVPPRISNVSLSVTGLCDSLTADNLKVVFKESIEPLFSSIQSINLSNDSNSIYDIQVFNSSPMNSKTEKSINITVDVEDCHFTECELLESTMGYPTTTTIASMLDSYGFKGTFFINIYELAFSERSLELQHMIKSLSDKGHEIALHCHQHTNHAKYKSMITNYSRSVQVAILKEGRDKLSNIIDKDEISFRAGGYNHNEDTLDALSSLGFKADSSIFFPKHGQVKKLTNFIEPHSSLIHDIFRIPVSPVVNVGRYGGIKNSKLDINWLNSKSIINVLKSKTSPCHLNYMMHSFSFLNKIKISSSDKEKYIGMQISPENENNRCVVLDGYDAELVSDFDDFLQYLFNSGVRVETCQQTATRPMSEFSHNNTLIPVLSNTK